MKRFLRKLFKPKPKYEPAGTIHYGEYHWAINGTHYEAIGQPNGLYDLHIDGEYIGASTKEHVTQIIIDHAKGQKH